VGLIPMAAGVALYWLPLGAGGHFVAFNGRVFETIVARREHRETFDLYHTALIVSLPEGRFTIESAWPIPDGNGEARGVMVEGPVGSPLYGRMRTFRYEVRCWRNGIVADIDDAVLSPQRICDDATTARRILALVPEVPALPWGRKPSGCSEMWNSNSVIAWLLARAGLDLHEIHPPPFGRAPGWSTGIELATQPTGSLHLRRRESASHAHQPM
jgi:hypothetical protein